MTGPSPLARADALEAAAFRDLYAAAPAAIGATTREIAGATLLIAPRVPVSFFNRAIGLGNTRAAAEADLDAIQRAYADAGVNSFWLHLSPGAHPADLARWLDGRGFAPPPRRSWAKFVRDARDPPPASTSLMVRPATPPDARAVGDVVCSAFGMPPALGPWFAALIGRADWHVLVACSDTRVVATGALYVTAEGAWLGVGATHADFRGRGAQSALLAARIDAAARAGCALLTTETGEPMGDEPNPSYDNILRSGFTVAGSRANYASPAQSGPGSLARS